MLFRLIFSSNAEYNAMCYLDQEAVLQGRADLTVIGLGGEK